MHDGISLPNSQKAAGTSQQMVPAALPGQRPSVGRSGVQVGGYLGTVTWIYRTQNIVGGARKIGILPLIIQIILAQFCRVFKCMWSGIAKSGITRLNKLAKRDSWTELFALGYKGANVTLQATPYVLPATPQRHDDQHKSSGI